MSGNSLKYEMTNETMNVGTHTLKRIRATRDFGVANFLGIDPNTGHVSYEFCLISEGTLGGWIEDEKNLSQENTAWVYENARVFGDAVVKDMGVVHDGVVCGGAKISGYAQIYGSSTSISGSTVVTDNAVVNDSVIECGNIGGNVTVKDAHMTGDGPIHIDGTARVSSTVFRNYSGNSPIKVRGEARVEEAEIIGGREEIYIADHAKVLTGAKIFSGAKIYNEAYVCGNCEIHNAVLCHKVYVSGDGIIVDKGSQLSGCVKIYTEPEQPVRISGLVLDGTAWVIGQDDLFASKVVSRDRNYLMLLFARTALNEVEMTMFHSDDPSYRDGAIYDGKTSTPGVTYLSEAIKLDDLFGELDAMPTENRRLADDIIEKAKEAKAHFDVRIKKLIEEGAKDGQSFYNHNLPEHE